MEYSILKSERVFEGKIFNIRIDEVQKPTGATMQIDVVEHSGAVTLIPMDEHNRILLVKQYRHAVGKILLELPAGTLDHNETPEDCAIRECREEIGMAPAKLMHLGGFYLAPGYSSEYSELYLATDLSPAPLPQDLDEDLVVEPLSIEEILNKISTGEIQDAKTLAGVLMLKQSLESN